MGSDGKRILLAEDDRFLRKACEAGLRRRGLTVIAAEDGEQALALARSEKPDLVLLDLLMPKLTGLDVLQALRADDATRALRVLILSNSSRDIDMQQAFALGIVGYWIKANLSLQQLVDQVEALLAPGDVA